MEHRAEPSWDDLRVLLALHRHKSFLAAGKALGVSTSTAARRIEALEAALGRPLVHRTSAGTQLEPDAQPLVALAEQLALGLSALRRDAGAEALAGTVRISLSEGFVRAVTERLCGLRRAHPGLRFELLSETRLADLARREADVGLRTARSPSPVLIERLLGRLPLALYASQSYVERRLGAPRLKRRVLPRQDVIGWEGAMARHPPFDWLERHGATAFVLRVNSYQAMLEATRCGQGIAVLGEPVVRGAGELVRLEIDAELPRVPIYLVYHREARRVPRIRLVAQALGDTVREGLR